MRCGNTCRCRIKSTPGDEVYPFSHIHTHKCIGVLFGSIWKTVSFCQSCTYTQHLRRHRDARHLKVSSRFLFESQTETLWIPRHAHRRTCVSATLRSHQEAQCTWCTTCIVYNVYNHIIEPASCWKAKSGAIKSFHFKIAVQKSEKCFLIHLINYHHAGHKIVRCKSVVPFTRHQHLRWTAGCSCAGRVCITHKVVRKIIMHKTFLISNSYVFIFQQAND